MVTLKTGTSLHDMFTNISKLKVLLTVIWDENWDDSQLNILHKTFIALSENHYNRSSL